MRINPNLNRISKRPALPTTQPRVKSYAIEILGVRGRTLKANFKNSKEDKQLNVPIIVKRASYFSLYCPLIEYYGGKLSLSNFSLHKPYICGVLQRPVPVLGAGGFSFFPYLVFCFALLAVFILSGDMLDGSGIRWRPLFWF